LYCGARLHGCGVLNVLNISLNSSRWFMLGLVYIFYVALAQVSEDRTTSNEKIFPEERDTIQHPKRCVLNKNRMGV
jgi:hypothetical protein